MSTHSTTEQVRVSAFYVCVCDMLQILMGALDRASPHPLVD